MTEVKQHLVHVNHCWCNQGRDPVDYPVVYNIRDVTCKDCLEALELELFDRLEDLNFEIDSVQRRYRQLED